MRKKLVVRSQRIRSLTFAEQAAVLGGIVTAGTSCAADPPPRIGTEHTRMCTDPWPPPPPVIA